MDCLNRVGSWELIYLRRTSKEKAMEQEMTMRTLTEEETLLLVSGGCKACGSNNGGGFGAMASSKDFEKYLETHQE